MADSADDVRSVFCSSDAAQALAAVHSVGGDIIEVMGRSLDAALNGSPEETRTYVLAYRDLGARLLEHAWQRPEIAGSGDRRTIGVMLEIVGGGSADAPFSPWTSRCDRADAVALDCTNRVRAVVGTKPLDPPAEGIHLDHADELAVARFVRRVRHHLNHPDDENPLRRIMELFQLNKSELGRLFGVSRQAVDGWLEHGVPGERQEKLAAVLALADLLERKLKPGRVPGVARRPADAYGGETMLSMLEQDRHAELLESVRHAFDWSHAA